jgi:hypothetical protein
VQKSKQPAFNLKQTGQLLMLSCEQTKSMTHAKEILTILEREANPSA